MDKFQGPFLFFKFFPLPAYQTAAAKENVVPGAVIAIQTFGDFPGFNPHCHVLVTDGCFYDTGTFRVAPAIELKGLEKVFRHKIIRMLLSKAKITGDMVSKLDTWKHSGFTVFCGSRIYPHEDTAMENLARYIIRASFSQERMTYLRDESKVIYKAKKGEETRTFAALEWLAFLLHIVVSVHYSKCALTDIKRIGHFCSSHSTLY